MKAMVLTEICEIEVPGRPRQRPDLPGKTRPLELRDVPVPRPGPDEILIKIAACGVCRTELDQIEGRIDPPRLPIIPGHQPVGVVAERGARVSRFQVGDRVGVAWIYSSCGRCRFCRSGQENLCDQFRGTGSHVNGGYAEYMVVSQDYAYRIPEKFADLPRAAPLMCAGVVGYRSLRLSGLQDGLTLGLYGFGAAHHLVLQTANALFPNSKKFVMTRNLAERELALTLGATWTGEIDAETPARLDCAIDTTPAWTPVVKALENLEKGGRLVVNLIRKEEADKAALLKLDYARHLWLEKEIKSVANVTRRDVEEFLALAGHARIEPEIQEYPLEEANRALVELKSGQIRGAKVLKIG